MSFYSDLKKFNNRTALILNDLNFSYTSLLEDADKIAKIIKKRSLIFILGDNDFLYLLHSLKKRYQVKH